MVSKQSAFLVAFLLVFVQGASALRCYVCNSAFDENCEDKHLPPEYLVDCSQKPRSMPPHDNSTATTPLVAGGNATVNFSVCRKQDFIAPSQTNGNHTKSGTHRVVRSCGWMDRPEKDFCKFLNGDSVIIENCSCLKEGCNSGSILHASIRITLSFIAFHRFL